jgi:hypothetical protein
VSTINFPWPWTLKSPASLPKFAQRDTKADFEQAFSSIGKIPRAELPGNRRKEYAMNPVGTCSDLGGVFGLLSVCKLHLKRRCALRASVRLVVAFYV